MKDGLFSQSLVFSVITMYRGDPLIVFVSSSLCKYCANPKSVSEIKKELKNGAYIY